jgi:hypothetical protein
MSTPNAAVAAPATATPANSAETPNTNTENTEIEASEAEEGDEPAEVEAKVEEKTAKPSKKEVKKAVEAEKRLKKLKLKVDGKEIEEEFDLDDEDRLIRELQMSKMGQKRAQEKADLEKQVAAFFKAFEADPFAAMKELGKDPNKVIDDYINQQLENAKKTPEQLAKEQLEKELQALKAEREREKEESKTKELQRLQEQAFQQYDMQMEQALAKSSLPKTAYNVKRIADYMLVALQAGKDVSPDDVIPLVEEELNSDLQDMFASLPEDKIEALLGEQVLNKLRKRRVAKAQAAQQAIAKPIKDTGASDKNAKEKTEKKMTYKDLFGI